MPPMQSALIEDAKLVFKNFRGEESPFNTKGKRNFAVLLDEGTASAMERDGWSIKYLKPREEGDIPQAFIKVNVNFEGKRPPEVVMITSRGRTDLNPETCIALDYADIKKVDLYIRPYEWKRPSGAEGVTAYLSEIYVTINESYLALKYKDVEVAAIGGQTEEDWLEGQVVEEEFDGRRAIGR